MSPRRLGFTLIELVVAILIGSILTSIALSSYGNVRGRFAVSGARNTFASLHARARAQAIEMGENVRIWIDAGGDSISLTTESGTRLESVKFQNEFDVDIRANSNYRVCMNPRGFADESCNNFNSAVTVVFWQGADSAGVRILPLGQLQF